MTITITVRKDGQGRVSNVAHEVLTEKWVATDSVYSRLVDLLRRHFPHCTIRRVK